MNGSPKPLEVIAFFLFSIIILALSDMVLGKIISLSKLGATARYLISMLIIAVVFLILWKSPLSDILSFDYLLSGALVAGIFMLPLFVKLQKRYLAALLALGISFLYYVYNRHIPIGPRIPGPLEVLVSIAIFWGAVLLFYMLSDFVAGVVLGVAPKANKPVKTKSRK